MAKQKKETVTAEIREEWLRQHERGKSPPVIGEAAGYDPRTVRKYLDIAKQERDSKEARSGVLRSALERHYDDLCKFAERLGREPGEYRVRLDVMETNTNKQSVYEPELGVALRQHIPRSPIWGFLNKISKMRSDRSESIKNIKEKIVTIVRADAALKSGLTSSEAGVFAGLIEAFSRQVEFWSRGSGTLDPEVNLRPQDTSEGRVWSYGAYGLGKVEEDHVPLIKEAITRLTAEIIGCEEMNTLKKTDDNIQNLEKKLRDEIAIIVLRRVVPGRCLYCPL